MATFDDAVRIALTLPEATHEGTGLGVGGKGFAWTYMQKIEGQKGRVERPDVLAVRVVNNDEKEVLIAADPEKFFTDDHYRGFPAVLVRLEAIAVDELTELLIDAWRCKAPRRLVKAFDAQPQPTATEPR